MMYRHSGGNGRSLSYDPMQERCARAHHTESVRSKPRLAYLEVLGRYMRSDSQAVDDAVQAGHPKAGTTTTQRRVRAIQIDVEFNPITSIGTMSVRLWILC
jgi:hypothetical protein